MNEKGKLPKQQNCLGNRSSNAHALGSVDGIVGSPAKNVYACSGKNDT